jgi:hypothetical protein
MNIDLWGSGILSYILPGAMILVALYTVGQIMVGGRGGWTKGIAMMLTLGIAAVAFSFYTRDHDHQAVRAAISQRYGLLVNDAQVGVLRENHSYRRYEPDITVDTKQGVANPYGTIQITQHGAKQKVMMYQAKGRWYLGAVPAKNAADQEVLELPLAHNAIPSVN